MTDLFMSQNDLIDGLRRFQDEFNKDFSHRDVFHELEFISKHEFQWIRQGRDEKEVIDRLFFYYIYHRKNVLPFIKALAYSYKWLYESIINSKNDKWISDYRRAINDIPNNSDWNVHRTKYLFDIQYNLKNLTRRKYLILFGKLGFGKKWLAADACRDYSVVSSMNFKIYWLNVSKCNTYELILEKMHRLKVFLQDDDLDIKYNAYSGSTINEIIHLRTHLRKVLEQPAFKDCLVVLTDVQDENIIKAFDLHCKMLLTTRHMEKLEKTIPRERRDIIDIDKGFSLDESNELFFKATHSFDLQQKINTFIHDIHEKCSGHPFIMSVIAKTFQNIKESDEKREKRCKNWKENLENYKFEDDCKKIQMSVNESLQLLENERLVENYKRMVVFTDNVDVPLEVLSKLWGTSHQSTETIVEKFHKYSLIERQYNENETCSLHYVHNKYLKSEVSEADQEKYHQLLLDKYEVETIFRNRNGLELKFYDDRYFHFFIGYHILGAKRFDLFDIYLDFGFLEEKIRIAKLPNILGDLKKFSNEIKQHEGDHKGLVDELMFFLPTIENLLIQSSDITLLQYALTHEGVVKKAAEEQSMKFTDRVWFNDANHLQQENQIIEIQANSKPKIVRFAQPGESLLCLIYLQDNNIMLHEIAPADYNFKPTLFRNDLISNSIVEMQIFRNEAFLVLNDLGKLFYYNIKVPKTSTRRPSIAAPFITSVNDHPLTIDNRSDKITCFYVIDQQSTSNVDLILGTSKGSLKFYRWTTAHKFEDNKHVINGHLKDLFRIAVIEDYAILINRSGNIGFVNLIDGSKMGSNIPMEQHQDPLNLHQGICKHAKLAITILVTANKVIQITHQKKLASFLMLKKENVFMASEEFDDFKILSSAMSKDSEYLILGTTNGIMVIDRYEKKIIYRRSISDHVLSLDVHRDIADPYYFLVSVFKDADKVISFHAFPSSGYDNFSMTQSETKFLTGDDQFDVKKYDNKWSLVAIDTKRNIHLRSCDDDFIESITVLPFKYEIKKICFISDRIVVCGCTNGHIYRIDLNMNTCDDIATMTGAITYMEKFSQTIIISTNNAYKIIELGNTSSSIVQMADQNGKATKAYQHSEHILLVVLKDCSIEFIDIKNKAIIKSLNLMEEGNTCEAEAYYKSMLAIATAKNDVFIFEFDANINEEIKIKSIEGQVSSNISSVAISPEKNVLAVGCRNGNIELFDLTQLIPIQTLESHKRAIMSLDFSPWQEEEGHLILLSLSESIIFWNVTHILNNRGGIKRSNSTPSRISARFKSPLKIVSLNTNLENSLKKLTLKERNWSNKTGSFDKRELLSCIKFIGKSAKKVVINDEFTRFVTIDNEGNVYHLRLIDQSMTENDDQQVIINVNVASPFA
ncbi:hypothetical protein PVAND_010454 [Polypedilum vanderplanki]|uniref:Uncharacterized protein n=1 Tax=Polypedilum vanderplanki TaxID=319348 RepID=A0A9J6CFY9_POLVA|nr:hypothetical protein PVAND_010454 [Polypedilum vanderplanki]